MFHIWLSKLANQQINFQGREPREWTPQLIEQLEEVSNLVLRDVYFLIDSILEGYITEFVVDTITSYNKVERNVFQGPRSRHLSFLNTWIKILVCEKGLLRM